MAVRLMVKTAAAPENHRLLSILFRCSGTPRRWDSICGREDLAREGEYLDGMARLTD